MKVRNLVVNTNVNQTLLAKPAGGKCNIPLTRADIYADELTADAEGAQRAQRLRRSDFRLAADTCTHLRWSQVRC